MADPYELLPVTDPAEIDSIRSPELNEIIGTVYPDGSAEAYRWSLERWRAKRADTSVEDGRK